MFGYPVETKHDDPALSENPVFLKTGALVVSMLDDALSMLGPDLQPLEEQLFVLGRRHEGRGCQPYHWPMVGVAFFHALYAVLGEKFSPEVQHGWKVLYNFMGYHMINGLKSHPSFVLK
jgi:hemoglobin-like flavoprotein